MEQTIFVDKESCLGERRQNELKQLVNNTHSMHDMKQKLREYVTNYEAQGKVDALTLLKLSIVLQSCENRYSSEDFLELTKRVVMNTRVSCLNKAKTNAKFDIWKAKVIRSNSPYIMPLENPVCRGENGSRFCVGPYGITLVDIPTEEYARVLIYNEEGEGKRLMEMCVPYHGSTLRILLPVSSFSKLTGRDIPSELKEDVPMYHHGSSLENHRRIVYEETNMRPYSKFSTDVDWTWKAHSLKYPFGSLHVIQTLFGIADGISLETGHLYRKVDPFSFYHIPKSEYNRKFILLPVLDEECNYYQLCTCPFIQGGVDIHTTTEKAPEITGLDLYLSVSLSPICDFVREKAINAFILYRTFKNYDIRKARPLPCSVLKKRKAFGTPHIC